MSGIAYLVGAGPGDPGLITVRGLELLSRADVVIADRLGTERLLSKCRPDAEIIDAGKAPGRAALTQDETNARLVEEVRAGRMVVRLKGGDPFVFGRGSEELQALHAAGLTAEVVPGITSAISAPAYAGVPVTHRGVATSFTVVTGHEDPTKGSEQTDWHALAQLSGTLVILMGMGRLAGIAEALVSAGRPSDQPVAVVQWGTTSRQRSLRGTLGTIAADCAREGIGSPAIVVVGAVAGLDGLEWLSAARPLTGMRIVVTRSRAQASELSERLLDLGADVVELPLIRMVPVPDSPELCAQFQNLDRYGTIIFTSVNGVACFFDRLRDAGLDARSIPRQATIVAVGPATADALSQRGVRTDVLPARFIAEGVLEGLADRDLAGTRILVARAREGRDTLIDGLAGRGAEVDLLPLYDTIAEEPARDAIERALAADAVTFTASSTVTAFHGLLASSDYERIAGLRIFSIGPATSATANDLGFSVHRESDEQSIPGLVRAILKDVAIR